MHIFQVRHDKIWFQWDLYSIIKTTCYITLKTIAVEMVWWQYVGGSCLDILRARFMAAPRLFAGQLWWIQCLETERSMSSQILLSCRERDCEHDWLGCHKRGRGGKGVRLSCQSNGTPRVEPDAHAARSQLCPSASVTLNCWSVILNNMLSLPPHARNWWLLWRAGLVSVGVGIIKYLSLWLEHVLHMVKLQLSS